MNSYSLDTRSFAYEVGEIGWKRANMSCQRIRRNGTYHTDRVASCVISQQIYSSASSLR
jgi:hypothetical protein